MSDKELRHMFKEYCEEPDYHKKDVFIRSLRKEQQSIGLLRMLMTQAGYINPHMWLLSLAVMIFAVICIGTLSDKGLIYMSDVMPFLAGFGIVEVFRANMYRMSELESATLFSARGVFFAKMTIIGILQVFTIMITAVLLGNKDIHGFIHAAVSLLIPYLLTTIICLELERTNYGRDNIWSCLGVSLFVLFLKESAYKIIPVYGIGIKMMSVIAVILVFILAYEIRKTMISEEYAWN